MGLTLLYSLLDAVKSKNSGLKTWFGIWSLGLESEIFNEKRWDFESYTRFQLGVGPSLVATSELGNISGNAVREALDRSP